MDKNPKVASTNYITGLRKMILMCQLPVKGQELEEKGNQAVILSSHVKLPSYLPFFTVK